MENRINGVDNQRRRPLFTEFDGSPFKFFIQKDLPEDVQASLKEAIKAGNGTIESKVPIKGYVLIKLGTAEADRLRKVWRKPDRPERYFVPYDWVDSSREAGSPVRQIFAQRGNPVRIYIHPIIANLNSRELLSKQILLAGGEPVTSAEEANVILAEPDTDGFEDLLKQYQGAQPQKYVEAHTWVGKCLERGIYFHSPNAYRNPGGRRAGDERTAFTEDDEANLCTWIAAVIPFKESGGRTGNKIYQELVSRVNDPGYGWVARHTWQSWRERYKKNSQRLDQHINAIVKLNNPGHGAQVDSPAKAQFGYFRLTEGRQKPLRKRRRKVGEADSPDQSESLWGPATPERSGIAGGSSRRRASEDGEWPIREGQAPTPGWAKRGLDDNQGGEQSHEMLKSGHEHLNYAPDLPQPVPLHPVDQAIIDIANEYQFLHNEVRTFYDRTGDMDATRERFAKLREIINATP